MADIIIHRCTLRVVRRQGWSWGPSPRHLLKAAVAALPLLVARKLGELLPDGTDTEISERVSLTVPIKLLELLALGAGAAPHTETDPPRLTAALDQRLTAAVERGLPGEVFAFEKGSRVTETTNQPPDLASQTPPDTKARGNHVFHVLLAWKQQGELEVHLASFTEQELRAWYGALLATILEFPGVASAAPSAGISQLIHHVGQRLQRGKHDRIEALRLGLFAFLEAGAQLQREPTDGIAVTEILAHGLAPFLISTSQEQTSRTQEPFQPIASNDAGPAVSLLKLPEPESGIPAPTPLPPRLLEPDSVAPEPTPSFPEPDSATPAPEVTVRRLAKSELHIRSVLPFLLLGPLARIGYLNALAATLEANALLQDAHVFAAALAFKVLTPPVRGWRRADVDLMVAATFAGTEIPPPGDVLTELARKLSGRLTALDSLLSYTLIKGHRPADPIILLRTTDETEGFLIVELEGLFPIAWASDLQCLKPTLKYFNETFLLVPHNSADPELLRELHASGYRFITDAPPTRGEPWRELHTPRQRWYTNDTDAKEATLLLAAEQLAGAAEETELIWRVLAIDRPSLPAARHSELERSLTLAASLALGTISWTLWRNRETVTPILAFERFGDLGARVRFTSTAVEVHLPLGRRQSDLYEHGLLADVYNVPWLEGRKVEFFGG